MIFINSPQNTAVTLLCLIPHPPEISVDLYKCLRASQSNHISYEPYLCSQASACALQ